jgi:hypothetical protein
MSEQFIERSGNISIAISFVLQPRSTLAGRYSRTVHDAHSSYAYEVLPDIQPHWSQPYDDQWRGLRVALAATGRGLTPPATGSGLSAVGQPILA